MILSFSDFKRQQNARNVRKKKGSLCHRTLLRVQTVVMVVLKSMGDAWRNTLRPNISMTSDEKKCLQIRERTHFRG